MNNNTKADTIILELSNEIYKKYLLLGNYDIPDYFINYIEIFIRDLIENITDTINNISKYNFMIDVQTIINRQKILINNLDNYINYFDKFEIIDCEENIPINITMDFDKLIHNIRVINDTYDDVQINNTDDYVLLSTDINLLNTKTIDIIDLYFSFEIINHSIYYKKFDKLVLHVNDVKRKLIAYNITNKK